MEGRRGDGGKEGGRRGEGGGERWGGEGGRVKSNRFYSKYC